MKKINLKRIPSAELLFRPKTNEWKIYKMLVLGITYNTTLNGMGILCYTKNVSNIRERLLEFGYGVRSYRVNDHLRFYKIIRLW